MVYSCGVKPLLTRHSKSESMRQLLTPCDDATLRCKPRAVNSCNRHALVIMFRGILTPAICSKRSATFLATVSDPSAFNSSQPCQVSTQDWFSTAVTRFSSCRTDKQIAATSSFASGGGPPPQNRFGKRWVGRATLHATTPRPRPTPSSTLSLLLLFQLAAARSIAGIRTTATATA